MISIDENKKTNIINGTYTNTVISSNNLKITTKINNLTEYCIMSTNHKCFFNNKQEIKDYIIDNIIFSDPYYQFIITKNNYKITIFMRDYINLVEFIIKNYTNVEDTLFL